MVHCRVQLKFSRRIEHNVKFQVSTSRYIKWPCHKTSLVPYRPEAFSPEPLLRRSKYHAYNSTSLFGNVYPNKPEILTKNCINNPRTEFNAKCYILKAKILLTCIRNKNDVGINSSSLLPVQTCRPDAIDSVANARYRKSLKSQERHHFNTPQELTLIALSYVR